MKTCSAFLSHGPCPSPCCFLIFIMVLIWNRQLLLSHEHDGSGCDVVLRGDSRKSPFSYGDREGKQYLTQLYCALKNLINKVDSKLSGFIMHTHTHSVKKLLEVMDMLIIFIWWWFHVCLHMPKCMKSYILNMCIFLYISWNSIELW